MTTATTEEQPQNLPSGRGLAILASRHRSSAAAAAPATDGRSFASFDG